jgi:hypothetical protein
MLARSASIQVDHVARRGDAFLALGRREPGLLLLQELDQRRLVVILEFRRIEICRLLSRMCSASLSISLGILATTLRYPYEVADRARSQASLGIPVGLIADARIFGASLRCLSPQARARTGGRGARHARLFVKRRTKASGIGVARRSWVRQWRVVTVAAGQTAQCAALLRLMRCRKNRKTRAAGDGGRPPSLKLRRVNEQARHRLLTVEARLRGRRRLATAGAVRRIAFRQVRESPIRVKPNCMRAREPSLPPMRWRYTETAKEARYERSPRHRPRPVRHTPRRRQARLGDPWPGRPGHSDRSRPRIHDARRPPDRGHGT